MLRFRNRWLALLALATSLEGVALGQSPGDADCDGRISANDPGVFASAIFTDPPEACPVADVNLDRRASAADLPATVAAFHSDSPNGPVVTFFGLVGASGVPLTVIGYRGSTPVYFRNSGSGFRIVIEGGPGTNGVALGEEVDGYDPLDPTSRPDLQLACTRDLGDGSPEVCDGGVPAVAPPHLAPDGFVSNAVNDLACHFDAITAANFGCTVNSFGNPGFTSTRTRLQFCALTTRQLEFPPGETFCSVRLRDRGGELGPPAFFAVQIGSGPQPPTFTATPRVTNTPTVRSTATYTMTPSLTRTPTRTPTPAASATPMTPTIPPTVTPTETQTSVRSPSATPTITPTRTRTATQTTTGTATHTRTASRTPTVTRTPSPLPPQGPEITFMGIARADDLKIDPIETTPEGIPVFQVATSGFRIVVEAKPGASGEDVGLDTTAFDPAFPPDLQVLVSRALGDGNAEVCDSEQRGGVPATDPPVFSNAPSAVAAMNDFGCRFLDGGGDPRGRTAKGDSCVADRGGEFSFVHPATEVQFCGQIDRTLCLPVGDTRVVARVRDSGLNLGPQVSIILRNSQSCR